MATGNRTLKLSILADVDDLKKKLGEADKAVENNSSKIADFGKKAALAFAAVGAAATAFAIQAVKNAAQDEAAQRKLEETIRASTKATEAQTKAVADYIDQTSIAVGITDDELRPAFSRLVRSTNDVEEAQKLLNLALDITAATGKPLEAVTNALGKAYDGNLTSLGRLGLGIDQSILKTKDFDLVYKNLAGTFGNFAENEAQTTEAQFRRIQIAIDEAKETIGAALLPILETLLKYITTFIIPLFDKMSDALAGKNGFGGSMSQVISIIRSVAIPVFDAMKVAFDQIKKTVDENREGLQDFIDIAKALAPIFGTVLVEGIKIAVAQISILIDVLGKVASIIKDILNGVINQINLVIRGINLIKPGQDIPYIGNIGTATASTSSYRAGERGLPTISTATAQTQPTVINNISVQAIDPEGAARAVQKVLVDSSARSTPTFGGGFGIVFQ
jgi:hypothetical protein